MRRCLMPIGVLTVVLATGLVTLGHTSLGTTVTDMGGNVYRTVTIGNQVWMAEDLRTTRYRNGDLIGTTHPATLDIRNESSPKYQWAYDGNEDNLAVYGRLYTWHAVADSRGIAPAGWHVPTEAEWAVLINRLGGESAAQGRLKEAGTSHWNSLNADATNESGFTALPGGNRDSNGSFLGIRDFTHWWTATAYDGSYAWRRALWKDSPMQSTGGWADKKMGWLVRCVRDAPAVLKDPNGPIYNLSTGERFASIQAAIDLALPGEVILVSPGTYQESLVLPDIPLTIRSANREDAAVVSWTVLAGNGNSPVVTLRPGTAIRSIQGLTIAGGMDGVVCPGARLSLSFCVITGHRDCGIEVSEEASVAMDHCIVAGSGDPGIRSLGKATSRFGYRFSKVDLNQCTIVQNKGCALEGDGITVANSILYGNGISAGGVQIKGNNVKVSYSDVQSGFGGLGNIDADPLFVAPGTWADPSTYVLGDLHLKSQAGHWSPRTCTWLQDDVTSPCIGAGDPNAAFGLEPMPNGGRVDLGAYGNTAEASRPPSLT
jgi:uncharacterized protein (TIGR02145 family)